MRKKGAPPPKEIPVVKHAMRHSDKKAWPYTVRAIQEICRKLHVEEPYYHALLSRVWMLHFRGTYI